MQKVITINLNGNAYQLDQSGYESLRAYLEHADEQLGSNPDKTEIIRDLEQSIAEKCVRVARPGKDGRVGARSGTDPSGDRSGGHRCGAIDRLGPALHAPADTAAPTAEAPLPDSRRRDAERHLQRPCGLLQPRPDDRARRVRRERPSSTDGDRP